MKFRKSWKRFWTLDRHHSDGFTLVELIVVIAIMAILAGVGTVGYSGYITNANKNADKVLVGNIIRAIETGVYSTMFELDDSFALSGIEYPVGYVVLSTDSNMQVNASDVKAHDISGECVFSDLVTVVSVEETNKSYNCGTWLCFHSEDKPIYSKKEVQIRYCLTHSKNQPANLDAPITRDTGYTMEHSGLFNPTHPFTSTGSFTLEAGTFVAEHGISQLYVMDSNGKCVLAANNGVDAGAIVTDGEGDNPIYEALTAAFGAGLSGTNLKYDGWTKDEGVNYATFLNKTGDMIQLVTDTYGTLNTMLGIIDRVNSTGLTNIDTSNYLSKDYTDSTDMMESFAEHVYSKYKTTEAWKPIWAGAATYAGTDYTFGMTDSKYHHDFVYSVTKAYNQGFGSYCEANGVDPTYVAAIYDFKSTPNENGLTNMDALAYVPRTVNTAAFNGATGVNTNYTLENAFLNISNTDTDETARAAFNQCKELYVKYIDDSNGPSACEKNGDAFHTMMETMHKTSGAARDEDNITNGNYFKYYNNYLGAMSAIYSGVEDAVKDGNVVVLVTVQNGIVKCDVSPSVANPRND